MLRLSEEGPASVHVSLFNISIHDNLITMEDSPSGLREIAKKISSENPELGASLAFYADMLATILELSSKVRGHLSPMELRYRELAKEVSREKKPLLDLAGEVDLPDDLWMEIMGNISSKVKEHREELSSALDTLIEAAKEGQFNPADLARYSIKGDLNYARGVAVGLGLDLDLVNAVALWTLQPVLIAMREITEKNVDMDGWLEGFCPICGSYTRTGFKRGGEAYLKCEICGMEWPHPESKCPFCGSENISSQPLNGGFLLYRCGDCGEYWKVVDEDSFEERIPRMLYPVITFPVDEMAMETSEESRPES